MCSINFDWNPQTRQGWQCPVCRKVWSPSITFCSYSQQGGWTTVTQPSTDPTPLDPTRTGSTKTSTNITIHTSLPDKTREEFARLIQDEIRKMGI